MSFPEDNSLDGLNVGEYIVSSDNSIGDENSNAEPNVGDDEASRDPLSIDAEPGGSGPVRSSQRKSKANFLNCLRRNPTSDSETDTSEKYNYGDSDNDKDTEYVPRKTKRRMQKIKKESDVIVEPEVIIDNDDKVIINNDDIDDLLNGESDDEIQVIETIPSPKVKPSRSEISCYNKNCRRWFKCQSDYYQHLSEIHFYRKLLETVEKYQPKPIGSKIVCPRCDATFSNLQETVKHFGVVHEVKDLLKQELLLEKREKRTGTTGTLPSGGSIPSTVRRRSSRRSVNDEGDKIKPSLFALDDEAPGELVPDVVDVKYPVSETQDVNSESEDDIQIIDPALHLNPDDVGPSTSKKKYQEMTKKVEAMETSEDETSLDWICELCGEQFARENQEIEHIALDHFQAGLMKELVAKGWKEGSKLCPENDCVELISGNMIAHYGVNHGAVARKMCKLKGLKGRTVVSLIDSNDVVRSYLENKARKRCPNVGIKPIKRSIREKVFEGRRRTMDQPSSRRRTLGQLNRVDSLDDSTEESEDESSGRLNKCLNKDVIETERKRALGNGKLNPVDDPSEDSGDETLEELENNSRNDIDSGLNTPGTITDDEDSDVAESIQNAPNSEVNTPLGMSEEEDEKDEATINISGGVVAQKGDFIASETVNPPEASIATDGDTSASQNVKVSLGEDRSDHGSFPVLEDQDVHEKAASSETDVITMDSVQSNENRGNRCDDPSDIAVYGKDKICDGKPSVNSSDNKVLPDGVQTSQNIDGVTIANTTNASPAKDQTFQVEKTSRLVSNEITKEKNKPDGVESSQETPCLTLDSSDDESVKEIIDSDKEDIDASEVQICKTPEATSEHENSQQVKQNTIEDILFQMENEVDQCSKKQSTPEGPYRPSSKTSHDVASSNQSSSNSQACASNSQSYAPNLQTYSTNTQSCSMNSQACSSTSQSYSLIKRNSETKTLGDSPNKMGNQIPVVGIGTECKICEKQFSRREFYVHVAKDHFKGELLRQMNLENTRKEELKCPNCSIFKTKFKDDLIVHYGAQCKPFPVKKLYGDYMNKNNVPLSVDICGFCTFNCSSPEDLRNHILEKHIRDVRTVLGLQYSFKYRKHSSNTSFATTSIFSCPLCSMEITDSYDIDILCKHFIKSHLSQFEDMHKQFRKWREGSDVEGCPLCLEQCASGKVVEHLVMSHYKDSLLAECGLTQHEQLACPVCPFITFSEKDILLHYGIDHVRVSYFYQEEMCRLAETGKLEASADVLKKLNISNLVSTDELKIGNMSNIETSPLESDLAFRRAVLDPSSEIYKELLKLKYDETGNKCGICAMDLKEEKLLVAHIGLRPHFKAKVYAKIGVARKSRDLSCKLCSRVCATDKIFWEHQSNCHFFDDLALLLHIQDRQVSCKDCGKQSRDLAEMVLHLGEGHGRVKTMYQNLQVSRQMLRCKLCAPGTTFQWLQQFKVHLAVTHFTKEIWKTYVRHPQQSCMLCNNWSPTSDHMALVKHVGMVHNCVEAMYKEKTQVNKRILKYQCQLPLCRSNEPSTEKDFLAHIGDHFKDALIQNCISVGNGLGPYYTTVYRCPRQCENTFASTESFYRHTSTDPGCQLSLSYYYRYLDHQRGQQAPVFMTPQQSIYRLREEVHAASVEERQLTQGAKHTKSCLAEKEVEDPRSMPIKISYDFFKDELQVSFSQVLPPKSFTNTTRTMTTGPFKCYFCFLKNEEPVLSDFAEFQIHLGKVHFSSYLDLMFKNLNTGMYECRECQDDFHNMEQLCGHLTANHATIDGMYFAAMPHEPPSPDHQTGLPKLFVISSLFPWLPEKTSVKVKHDNDGLNHKHYSKENELSDAGQFYCCVCEIFLFGKKAEVYRHFIDKHYRKEMEKRFAASLTGLTPLSCPMCEFKTYRQLGQSASIHRNHLLYHIGNAHRIVEELFGSELPCPNSSTIRPVNCVHCPATFTQGNQLEELNKHYLSTHKSVKRFLEYEYEAIIQSSTVPLVCPFCDFKTYLTKSGVSMEDHRNKLFLHLCNSHNALVFMDSFIPSEHSDSHSPGNSSSDNNLLDLTDDNLEPDSYGVGEMSSKTYTSPRPFQCLVCHEDKQTVEGLAFHMMKTGHLNMSWAISSNLLSHPEAMGIWYQKTHLSYTCAICYRHYGKSEKHDSLNQIFAHIISQHNRAFCNLYLRGNKDFILCKVCDSYVKFNEFDKEDDRRRTEVEHYFKHGSTLATQMGIILQKSNDEYYCNLCEMTSLHKSFSMVKKHIKEVHQQSVTSSFRDFDTTQILRAQSPKRCCICKYEDTTLDHLSNHSLIYIGKLGLLDDSIKGGVDEVRTCACCKHKDKDVKGLLEHFNNAHNKLFNFLSAVYDSQNQAAKDELACNSNTEKCKLCSRLLSNNDFNQHLLHHHQFHRKMREALNKQPLVCIDPNCKEILSPGLESLVTHCQRNHDYLRKMYFKEVKMKENEKTHSISQQSLIASGPSRGAPNGFAASNKPEMVQIEPLKKFSSSYECNICSQPFGKPEMLKEHLVTLHFYSDLEKKLKGTVCPVCLTSTDRPLFHFYRAHAVLNVPDFELKELKEDQFNFYCWCNSDQFLDGTKEGYLKHCFGRHISHTKLSKLLEAQRARVNIKLLNCPNCNFTTDAERKLITHWSISHKILEEELKRRGMNDILQVLNKSVRATTPSLTTAATQKLTVARHVYDNYDSTHQSSKLFANTGQDFEPAPSTPSPGLFANFSRDQADEVAISALSRTTVIKEQAKDSKEWNKMSVCIVCNPETNIQGLDLNQRSNHFYEHFKKDMEIWLHQNADKYYIRNHQCPECKTKHENLSKLYKHFGVQHKLYKICLDKHVAAMKTSKQFQSASYKSNTTSDKSETVKKITKQYQPTSYESKFAAFALGAANRDSSFESKEMAPQEASFVSSGSSQFKKNEPNSYNNSQMKPQHSAKDAEGEQCKVCGKFFAKMLNHHYISHFRDKLIEKYPSSFTGEPPFKCSKCNFCARSKSDKIQQLKQLMLSHIIGCKDELKVLLEREELKKSRQLASSSQPKIMSPPPRRLSVNHSYTKSPQISDSGDQAAANTYEKIIPERFWALTSEPCLICKCDLDIIPKQDRITHYIGHFQQIKSVFGQQWEMKKVCFICFQYTATEEDYKKHLERVHFRESIIGHVNQSKGQCCYCPTRINKLNPHETIAHLVKVELVLEIEILRYLRKNKIKKEDIYEKRKPLELVMNTNTENEIEFIAAVPMKMETKVVEPKIELMDDTEKANSDSEKEDSDPGKGDSPAGNGDCRCQICKFACFSKDDLFTHLYRKHEELKRKIHKDVSANFSNFYTLEAKKLNCTCPICGEEMKATRAVVGKHWAVDHKKIDPMYQQYLKDPESMQLAYMGEQESTTRGRSKEVQNLRINMAGQRSLSKLKMAETIELTDSDSDSEEDTVELTTLEPRYINTFDITERQAQIEKLEKKNLKKLRKSLDKYQTNEKVFVQMGPCYQVSKEIPQCHECDKICREQTYAASGICCCFEGFRKLRFAGEKLLTVGFLNPKLDPKENDVALWKPNVEKTNLDMTEDIAKFILQHVGDLYCNLVAEEKDHAEPYIQSGREIVWKKAHQQVREMCDVCSTTIFNYHYTCDCCGFLVCPDCFLARKKGTKYRVKGTLAKPYRTRKRMRSGLDINLWPKCFNEDIHVLDKLILTQMVTGSISTDIANKVHELSSYYKLKRNCVCCQNVVDEHGAEQEIYEEFTIVSLKKCLSCPIKFTELDITRKRLHLCRHYHAQVVPNKDSTECDKCGVDAGTAGLLAIHKGLIHEDVDKMVARDIQAEEDAKQEEMELEVDKHDVCKICAAKLEDGKDQKRQHYIAHIESKLADSISDVAPYKCKEDDCHHVELDRRRLVKHICLAHKQLDTCLNKFLDQVEDSGAGDKDSWIKLVKCMQCGEKFESESESLKRNHYMKHFRREVESRLDLVTKNILEKGSSFKCGAKGCNFSVASDESSYRIRILQHMGITHRIVDPVIEFHIKEKQKDSSKSYNVYGTQCKRCEFKFKQEPEHGTLKSAKSHYSSHFRAEIENEFSSSFSGSTPLACKFSTCKFTTENVESEQYGHHKRKLIVHIGHAHGIFSKLIDNLSIEGIGAAENGPSEKFLRFLKCPICDDDFSQRNDKYKIKHFSSHFSQEVSDEYPEISAVSPSICPICKEFTSSQVMSTIKHMCTAHGLFDKLIELYTKKLDYVSEKNCRICYKDFENTVSKSSALKKHYAVHFKADIEKEFLNFFKLDGDNQLDCPLCDYNTSANDPKMQLVIHIGTQHGYYCRLLHQIEKEMDEEIDADILFDDSFEEVPANEVDFFSKNATNCESNCMLCGETVISKKEKRILEKMKIHMMKHFDSLLSKIPGVEAKECTKCEKHFQDENEAKEHFCLSHDNLCNIIFDVFKVGPEFDLKLLFVSSDFDRPDKVILLEKDLMNLEKCCFKGCKTSFLSVDDMAVQLHLVRHCAGDLLQDLPTSAPFSCPVCRLDASNLLLLLVHYGVCHHEKLTRVLRSKIKEEHLDASYASVEKSIKKIERWTLPKGTKRYKSTCLLCGSVATLYSTDRIEKLQKDNSEMTLEDCLSESFKNHIITKHLKCPSIGEDMKCPSCKKEMSSQGKYENHYIFRHMNLEKTLAPIFLGRNCRDTFDIKTLFVTIEHDDFLELDMQSLVSKTKRDEHDKKRKNEDIVTKMVADNKKARSDKEQTSLAEITHNPIVQKKVDFSPPCPTCGRCIERENQCSHMCLHFYNLMMRKVGGQQLDELTTTATLPYHGTMQPAQEEYVQNFIDTNINNWLGSEPVVMKLQQRLKNIVVGKFCVLCEKDIVEGRSQHFFQHFTKKVDVEINADEEIFACDFCDGFPEFESLMELRKHNFNEHQQWEKMLLNLHTVDAIADLRKRLNITVKTGTQELGTKRKHDNPIEEVIRKIPKYDEDKNTVQGPLILKDKLGALLQTIGDDSEEEDGELDLQDIIEKEFCDKEGLVPGLNENFTKLGPPDVGLSSKYPSRAMTMQVAKQKWPGSKHSWLCEGRLLHLHEPHDPENIKLFKEHWGRGQPVVISNSTQHLDKNLWHPKAFQKDFGHMRADLVNCLTGKTIPRFPLNWFWEGFDSVSHRPLDGDGTTMLLKLKDWPAAFDIASYIPKRFDNLILEFPIQQYTLREGLMNLASYIPDYFLRPELGPKMYIAYGSSLYSNKASTNLHIDMSDAVNLLVAVAQPEDCDPDSNMELILKDIDEAGCDIMTKKWVRKEGVVPGALWHIYHPSDLQKIRDLLNKVAVENGKRLDPHDDPIHDQSKYLDATLRQRLYKEYGVQGYAIVQCAGDTVFIPAGAAHQVRNLSNCIKIAEDFVSPELADNCLTITQEFRKLTEHHTNHEDKLQIKNMIYHSIKDAVAVLEDKMIRNIKIEK